MIKNNPNQNLNSYSTPNFFSVSCSNMFCGAMNTTSVVAPTGNITNLTANTLNVTTSANISNLTAAAGIIPNLTSSAASITNLVTSTIDSGNISSGNIITTDLSVNNNATLPKTNIIGPEGSLNPEAGLGSSPSVSYHPGSNDNCGGFYIKTGSGCSAGPLMTVSMNSSFNLGYHIVMTPRNVDAVPAAVYAYPLNESKWQFASIVALPDSTIVEWSYIIFGSS